MKRRTLLLCLILSLIGTATIGCQGKKAKKGGIAKGRDARGGASGAKASDRKFGGIYMSSGQTQDSFWQSLYTLTYAQLEGLPEDQQMGYVSGNATSTATGVRFWGDVKSDGKGAITQNESELHIIVYDGGAEPITMNIGPKLEGFISASGTYTATAADLRFEDIYGMIRLRGSISGGNFTGKVYYYTYQTGSSKELLLGDFKVLTSGFFR